MECDRFKLENIFIESLFYSYKKRMFDFLVITAMEFDHFCSFFRITLTNNYFGWRYIYTPTVIVELSWQNRIPNNLTEKTERLEVVEFVRNCFQWALHCFKIELFWLLEMRFFSSFTLVIVIAITLIGNVNGKLIDIITLYTNVWSFSLQPKLKFKRFLYFYQN